MLVSILFWLLGGLLLLAVVVAVCLVLATWWIAAKAERLVPASGKFVEIDGNRIHYVETGEGSPIVFLHGLGAQLHHFRHTLFGHFGAGTRHRPVSSNEQMMTVDPNTTGSINTGSDASGLNSLGNPGPAGPCASNMPGPDANAGLNVNDQYCGK
jgi:hypothetical protein